MTGDETTDPVANATTGPAANPASTGLLFLGTAFLWGTGAIVTTTQVAVGSPEPSVAIRMVLVGTIALLAAAASGRAIALPRHHWPRVCLQGVFFFGIGFIAFYHATSLIPSGVAALILSSAPLFAAALGLFLLGNRLSPRGLAGILLGITGLGIIVTPQLAALGDHDVTLQGMAWAALAAAGTGAGTLVGERNHRAGLSPFLQMGWGALTGASFAGLAMLVMPGIVLPVADARYLAGLAYMVLIASVLCFALYLRLVARVGAARGSYALTLVPLFALFLSMLFEGLAIDARILIGAAAILGGNVLVWKA